MKIVTSELISTLPPNPYLSKKYIGKQNTLEPNLLSPAGSNNLEITENSKIQT